jgi:lysophospholipase L1-like esterase
MANEPAHSIVELRMHTPNSERLIDVSMLDQVHPTSRLRVDARSYVQPSFQHNAPDVTIAFLGGSTTECKAVKEALRFPARVSELFEAQKLKVNTLNAGRGGNTLHDSINILLNHVVQDRPDVVVVMNVANDVGVLAQFGGNYAVRSRRAIMLRDVVDWFKSTASQHLHLAGVARQSMIVLRGQAGKAEPGELIDRQQRLDPVFAATLPRQVYEQRLRVFIGVARGLGITPVLMTEPFSGSLNQLTPQWADLGSQDLFNEIVRKIGEQEKVLVIDLVQHVRDNVENWNQPMKVFYDGIHVTDYGSDIYARHIAERLAPLVQQVAAQERVKPAIGEKYPRTDDLALGL